MVMASLLRDQRIDDFDVIAIQEPWKNPYTATTHHPAKDSFTSATPRDIRKARQGSASLSTKRSTKHDGALKSEPETCAPSS
jgi:hypothetical protein